MPLQKILFTKGMNSDSSPELFPEGESRYRLNVRVINSENGEDQSAETMKGNSSVSYTLPAGLNTVIGSKEYKGTGKVYYFIRNSLTDHSILEYTISSNTIALVFQDAILNFSLSHLITGINIVELDSSKHLLYWTDFYNRPRKLNIEKAKYYSAGNYTLGYKSPFDETILNRIKVPPTFPPTYVWDNDTNQLVNHLFKRLFQFKVQFVYDDYEVSAWSPISDYVMPITTLPTVNPTGEDFASQDNMITITVPTGSSIVTKIRIAAKELSSTADPISPFDFSLIAELDKSILSIGDDTTYDFNFYNEGNYVTLEVNESNKLFDNVPLLSKAQELCSDNRICDGLIKEGFDPVDIDMRLPVDYTTVVDTNTNSFFPKRSYLKSGGIYKRGIVYYNFANQSGTANITGGKTSEINAEGRYGTTLYIPFVTDVANYTVPNPAALNNMQYVPTVSWEIYNAPPSWATHYQIVSSRNEAMARYIQYVGDYVFYTDQDLNVVAAASATYVILYIGSIWGRYKTENPKSRLTYDWVPGDRIRFIANNDWASTSPYLPAASTDIDAFFAFNEAEVVRFDSSDGTVTILMNPDVPQNLEPGCLFEIYQPAKTVINDNEILYEIGETHALDTDSHGNLVHTGPDADQIIVAFTSSSAAAPLYTCNVAVGHGLIAGDKVKFYNDDFNCYGAVDSVTATTVVIDITGFTIVGSYTTTAGTITKAALGVFTSGDCFRRYCDMAFNIIGTSQVYRVYSYIETSEASNMFLSNAADYGRPNKIDPNSREIIRKATVRYSERLIPQTTINGLSSVFDFNYQEYNSDYGGIYKLWSRKQELVAYQERKVMGIGILQAIFTDPSSGQRIVGSSTEVLNSQPFYYAGEFGIGTRPESHAFYGDVAWHLDVPRGVALRLSNDGLTPISDTGNMHNYFTNMCRLIMNYSGTVNILGVYDVKFSEYIVSFSVANRGQFRSETLAWNEDANVWSTFYSYVPDYMCSAGVNIISFSDGALYTHNTNSVYNNFYGGQYTSQLWGYCNMMPSNMKVFKALSLESDTGWDAVIETPSGQTTALIQANFQDKEGFMYSSILMDDNTPNIVPFPVLLPNARFEGNPMRGPYALIKLEYLDTDYNKIFAMNVMWVPSQRSNQ